MLYKRGLGYSALSTARAAINSFTLTGDKLGQDTLIKRFMRGVFILRPALPRYNVTWDASKVLDYLSSISVNNLKQLTLTVVMLLCLLSGQRLQSLHYIDMRNIEFSSDYVKIRFGDLLKQSRPNYHLQELVFKAFHDKRLCIVHLLKQYMNETKLLRNNETALFISFCRPHKKVTKDTIGRWVKMVMKEAGIDISIFRPHSCRSSAASYVNKLRLPLATILRTVGWSSDCTFRKYYNKPVTNDTSFADTILSGNRS